MPVNLPANGEEKRRERGRACAQTPRLFFLFDSSHPSSTTARYIFPLSIEIYYSTEHTRRYEGTVAVRLRRKGDLEPRSGYRQLSLLLLPSLIAFPTNLATNLYQPRTWTQGVRLDRWTSLSFSSRSRHNIASLTGERAERKNLIGVCSPRGPSSSCSHLSRPLSPIFRSTI